MEDYLQYFYKRYRSLVEFYMEEGVQKNYYKQCDHVELCFNRVKGNHILLIFFQDINDYNHIIDELFGWKISLYYTYSKVVYYNKNSNKEIIVNTIIQAIAKIYKNGDLPYISINRKK